MSDEKKTDTKELTPIERMRAEVHAKREANRRAAEAAEEAVEMARLEDESAFEAAKEKACTELGYERVIGCKVAGAGHAILVWPDQSTWRGSVNRGILKPDKMTDELCEDFVVRCVRYPEREKFREMLKRNPTAARLLTLKLIESMTEADEATGK